MTAPVLVARLALAALFAIAGLAKLARPAGWRQTLPELGVPSGLQTPVALLVPLTEIAVAVALALDATARAGAIAALVLLSLMTVVVAYNVRRGRTPECNCFGSLRDSRLGWSTVARNLLLGMVAALVLWSPSLEPTPTLLASVGAAAALLVIGFLLLQLLRQNGRVLARIQALESSPAAVLPELAIGALVPPLVIPDERGRSVALADLSSPGDDLLLAFVEPGCAPCAQLLPELAGWSREARDLSIVLISGGGAAGEPVEFGADFAAVLHPREDEATSAFRISGTPAAVLIGADGRIKSAVALGAEAIADLLRSREPATPPSVTGSAVALGGVAAMLAASPSIAQADAETDQIKATLNGFGPQILADSNALSTSLVKIAKAKRRKLKFGPTRAVIAEGIDHYGQLRAELVALSPTGSAAQAARDAAVASVDSMVLALGQFDLMLGQHSKKARKRSTKSAFALLEQARESGFYANVGLGCTGAGC